MMWKVIKGRVVYKTPLGWVLTHFQDTSLTMLSLPAEELEPIVASFPAGSLPEREMGILAGWLEAFFARRPQELPLEIAPAGTEFSQKVWEATRLIPYGQTRSYSWIAEKLGSPRAQRAVGGALRRNPLPLVIPCHRVIRADGALGGFGGSEPQKLKIKEKLLAWEVSP